MMQDKSTDKQDTWDFVERRIAEVMQVGQLLNKNKDVASALSGGLISIIQGVIPSKIDDSEMLKK
jgi:ubiquinone biosynthesis protein COQ9